MRVAIVVILGVVGVAASLSGAVGIVRLPDLYLRLQASTKAITVGAIPVLLALVVGEGFYTQYASRALVVAFLLLVVNPAASHALARAAYKGGIPMWPGAVRDDPAAREKPES